MILQGDCRERMAEMEENSIDAIVCDPPYELGFMGKKWDGSGIAYDQEVWRQAWRVLKPGGYLLAFGGTRTYHRLACAIEDAGLEIRDCISWVYGSGFPKSLDVSKAIDRAAGAERKVIGEPTRHGGGDSQIMKGDYNPPITAPATDAARQWDGWGTALKPAHEPIVMARKTLSEKTLAANVLRWGCGAVNVDGCRIGTGDDRSLLIGCSPYETLWAEELNLCNTCAKHVENCVIHIGQDQYLDFAIENARTNITGKDDLSQLGTCKLDIGCLDGTKGERIDTSLSTGGYGKTQTALSRRDSASTTSTEIRRITESKTCLLCGSQNTSASIREILTNIQNPQHRQIIAGHIERIIQSNEKNAQRLNASEGQGLKQSGRWPSNLILGHAPGCVRRGEDCVEGCAVRLIAEQSGHLKSGKVKPYKNNGGWKQTSDFKTGSFEASEGTAARFFFQVDPDPLFYCAKASRAERNRGLEGMPTREAKTFEGLNSPEMRAARGRQAKETTRQNHHPTVKPLKLMRYLVRLVTPPGGTVLDPFAGSGTTLIAAKEEGFRYIGIELEPEYVEIAEARLAAAERPPATLEDFG